MNTHDMNTHELLMKQTDMVEKQTARIREYQRTLAENAAEIQADLRLVRSVTFEMVDAFRQVNELRDDIDRLQTILHEATARGLGDMRTSEIKDSDGKIIGTVKKWFWTHKQQNETKQ
jgi:hypothetical protein